MDLKIGDYVLLTNKLYTPSEHHPLVGTFFETYGIVKRITGIIVIVEWQKRRKLVESGYDEADLLKVEERDLCSYYIEPAYNVKPVLKCLFPDFKRKITLSIFNELTELLEGRIRLYTLAELMPLGYSSPHDLFKLIVHPDPGRQKNGCKSIW